MASHGHHGEKARTLRWYDSFVWRFELVAFPAAYGLVGIPTLGKTCDILSFMGQEVRHPGGTDTGATSRCHLDIVSIPAFSLGSIVVEECSHGYHYTPHSCMNVTAMSVLEKFRRLRTAIKWNGGFIQSLKRLTWHDDLKVGCFVGEDQYGNKYYENNCYFFGRNRWVEFSPAHGYDYDASMIPPEWFGWMHYRTDLLPCRDPTRPTYPWQIPHVMNQSGTPDEYVPYDTTRPKIEAWQPPRVGAGATRATGATTSRNRCT